MTLEDQYKCLIGAYYGVVEMDDYKLKAYVLKNIENYIKDFIHSYQLSNFDYRKKSEEYEKELSLETKLQDALIILNKLNESRELILMIQIKLKELIEK